MITFQRLRPTDDANELWASTRRRAGTTVAEVPDLDSAGHDAILAGGLLAVGLTPGSEAAAWAVPPRDALELAG